MQTDAWKHITGEGKYAVSDRVRTYRHQLTHQTIFCNFIYIHADAGNRVPAPGFSAVKMTGLSRYAVPRLIDRYLNDLKLEGLL